MKCYLNLLYSHWMYTLWTIKNNNKKTLSTRLTTACHVGKFIIFRFRISPCKNNGVAPVNMTLFQESLNPDRFVRWRGLQWCWEAEPGRLGPLFQNVFILFPTWTSNYSNAKCLMILLTVYPKKYAHGFVVLCFVVVMQSFIVNSHEVFIHIH